ncbi:MAG TPA: hypothetical protein VL977_05940, partial [Solirubrobacteraceae bacterium]|nr:hypothetical protein [Solirubrobacteraceae bacterium]
LGAIWGLDSRLRTDASAGAPARGSRWALARWLAGAGLPDAAADSLAVALLDHSAYPTDYVPAVMAHWDEPDEEAFARTAHRLLLSREPSSDELHTWTVHLLAGGSRFDMLRAIADSPVLAPRDPPPGLFAALLAAARESVLAVWSAEPEEFLAGLHLALLGCRPTPVWIAERRAAAARGERRALAIELARSPAVAVWGVEERWLRRLPRDRSRRRGALGRLRRVRS